MGEPTQNMPEPSKNSSEWLQWANWLGGHWDELVKGTTFDAKGLPYPGKAGFDWISIAEPVGQDEDWALSLSDGSRIHVHYWKDGAMTVHRDKYDPSKGIVPATAHFVTEAPSAKLVAGAGAGWLAFRALRRLLLGCVLGAGMGILACAPGQPADMPMPPDFCMNDYAALVVGMALDMTQSCKPQQIDECGTMTETVIARWEPKFIAWESRCAEGRTE